MDRIRAFFRRVRESLFLIPLASITLFAGLAALTLLIDRRVLTGLEDTPFLLNSTVTGGRTIATTVATATITVAAIVFSITALSSQIAASQYSPRSIIGFFEDRVQQLVIGLIAGTFTYALLVLGSLSTAVVGAVTPSPSLAITVAVVLGVISAIGMAGYIDHSLKQFQIDAVVSRLSRDTVAALRRQRRADEHDEMLEASEPGSESYNVTSLRSGWVQGIDAEHLATRLPSDTTIRVQVRLGEAVSEGDQLAKVWGDSQHEEPIAKITSEALKLAGSRSIQGDPSFGVRQLADIALRALSIGVNDPTTAVDVIHHLKAPIREALTRDPPSRVHHGPDGQRVFLAATPSRSEFVHGAFSEIRLSAQDQPAVGSALLEVLGDLMTELEGVELSNRSGPLIDEWNLTIDGILSSALPEPDIQRVLRGRTKLPGDEDGD
jgi:uncharacterized membrane protein